VQARGGLALALEQVDLGFHERGASGDRDELGRELGQLLRREAGARREALGAQRELFLGGRPPDFVAGRLGPGLVDEELDLLDLALEVGGLGREARGEIGGGRGDRALRRRVRRARRLDVGFRRDLSPPAS
jgi:hypothetical protein